MTKEELLKQYGNPKVLGEGTWGTVYDIGDNQVLKITASESEFSAAQELVGKRLHYVVEFEEAMSLDGGPLFYIVREAIRPLTLDEDAQFNRVYDAVEAHYGKSKYILDVLKEYDPQFMRQLKESDPELSVLYKWAVDCVEELADNGVNLSDFTVDNIGKTKGGDLVMFDIQ